MRATRSTPCSGGWWMPAPAHGVMSGLEGSRDLLTIEEPFTVSYETRSSSASWPTPQRQAWCSCTSPRASIGIAMANRSS
jgi:hypothetical protein